MDKVLHKNEVIDRISDKLLDTKIEIGENGKVYKRKYHLKYTKVIIANVLNAFWDVVAEAIEDGDTVKLNNYAKFEPLFYKGRIITANNFQGMNDNPIPDRYKVRFKMGERLKEACRRLYEKKNQQGTNRE